MSGDLRYFVSLTFTFTVAPYRMINLVNPEISRGRCPTTTGLSRLTVFLLQQLRSGRADYFPRELFQAFHLVSDSTALYKRGNRVVHMGRRNSIPANSKSPFQLWSWNDQMTEMYTRRHPIHVIIDRKIAWSCETDQMAEFHIILTLI